MSRGEILLLLLRALHPLYVRLGGCMRVGPKSFKQIALQILAREGANCILRLNTHLQLYSYWIGHMHIYDAIPEMHFMLVAIICIYYIERTLLILCDMVFHTESRVCKTWRNWR